MPFECRLKTFGAQAYTISTRNGQISSLCLSQCVLRMPAKFPEDNYNVCSEFMRG